MPHKGILSSAFNMSLGFIPMIISILACELTTQDSAIYLGTVVSVVACYLLHRRRGVQLPNFILGISTGVLLLISLATLIPADIVPVGALPLTLEASILIPLLILYLHKRRFINHFLMQSRSCHKRLYAQGAEAAVVSARITLLLGGLHFIAISLVLTFQHPISNDNFVLLYKVMPPAVFVVSILLNQIAILFFNQLMSHTEYVPVVNTRGDVIGKTLAIEAINYKNAYINPVIRLAISVRGKLLLCERPSTAILDKNKTDIPLECYLRFGETLPEGVMRLCERAVRQEDGAIKPEFNIVYHFENEVTNRLIYLFIAEIDDERLLSEALFRGCKQWCFKQIEENLGKGFFSCCFEEEYEHLKNVIYIREKYKES